MPSYTGTLMRYKSLKERSIFVEGPRLYNSLPRYLREHSGSIVSFKACLDSFLSGIPDQPDGNWCAGSLSRDGKPSNGIQDWMRTLNMYNWMPDDGVMDAIQAIDICSIQDAI